MPSLNHIYRVSLRPSINCFIHGHSGVPDPVNLRASTASTARALQHLRPFNGKLL
ncbi:hypothetical protein HanPSC8_Chr16g0733011 [Helianthus annuus]|nr:hypothetical protein HanPSC8_Chr16g0733011 [Helianthus annuus]